MQIGHRRSLFGCIQVIGTKRSIACAGFHVLAGCRLSDDVERMNNLTMTNMIRTVLSNRLDSQKVINSRPLSMNEVTTLTVGLCHRIGIFNKLRRAGFGRACHSFHHQPCADERNVPNSSIAPRYIQLTMRLLGGNVTAREGRDENIIGGGINHAGVVNAWPSRNMRQA